MQKIETLEELERLLGQKLSAYEGQYIDHAGIRISFACRNVVQAMKAGCLEAISIGIALILHDPHLPFGKLIKSAIARALRQRRELLLEAEIAKLAGKTAELLNLPFCPRELEDYCHLIKQCGPLAIHIVHAFAHPSAEKSRRLLDQMSVPIWGQTNHIH